jgi:hypothetical protein
MLGGPIGLGHAGSRDPVRGAGSGHRSGRVHGPPNGEIKIAYKVCSQTKKEEGCEKTRQGCSWHGSTS